MFQNALMTFEDEKLQESLQTLRDMEKRCAQDIGWLKVVRYKVFGSDSSSVSVRHFLQNFKIKLSEIKFRSFYIDDDCSSGCQ